MDYFKILNLNREPFSNSPEPDFFYQSAQHLGCLQNLEIAIRLRRGLNVVMGNVGTGKTTLCRELLIRLAQSEEDRREVETHLLLDPSATTPAAFLCAVATAFGIPGTAPSDEWQLKEGIKNHLYQQGVVEKKTVVLLIDEGQKLPAFALEILREFLNYETNEFKLLQIVIFAQDEFKESLLAHKNLAGRVNQFIFLGPLNFRETRELIALRIAQSSEDGPGRLFTWPGMLAIYKFTGGYPRRVISLCHQSMLAMIIQNRNQAGWFTVRSCAARASVERTAGQRRWPRIAVPALLGLIVVAVMALKWESLAVREPPFSGHAIATDLEPAPVPAVVTVEAEPAPAVATPPAAAPLPPSVFSTKKPKVLGRIIVDQGESAYGMLRRIYGAYDEEQLQAFVRGNHRIKNINRIIRGEVITFPAIPVETNPLPPDESWVAVTTKGSLGEAYEALGRYPRREGRVRLFPYWNGEEGLVFAVLLRQGFPDEKAAGAFIQRLPAEFSPGARVIARWPEGTEFYAR